MTSTCLVPSSGFKAVLGFVFLLKAEKMLCLNSVFRDGAFQRISYKNEIIPGFRRQMDAMEILVGVTSVPGHLNT